MKVIQRKILYFLIVPIFFLILSGCVEYTAKFYLNLDGSGVLDVVYVVNKSLLATVVKQRMGNTNFLPLTKEGVEEYYKKKKGVKLIKVDFKDLGPQTLKIHIMVSFENISYLDDQQFKYWWGIEGGRYTLKIHLKKVGDYNKNNPIIEKAIKEAMSKYHITFEAHLPRKVVESNADEIDWNTVTWKISLYDMTHMKHDIHLYASIETHWYEVAWWFLKEMWHRVISIF